MSSQKSYSTIEAKSFIERAGLYIVKDAEDRSNDGKEKESRRDVGKGEQFAQFYNNGYLTKTPEGLEFVYQNTIGDKEIGPIVLSIIKQPRWGYSRYFSTLLSADYAWFFHNHNEKIEHEPIHTLVVQFWLPGSRVVFYEGSQLQFFDAKEDRDNYGVLNTHRSNMYRKGIVWTEKDMPNGGYTIIDSRIGWTYEKGGGFMNIALGEDGEVQNWGNMELPDTQALRAKVAELESRGFSTRFVYINYEKQRKA
ncbi:unnamed protein product [Clonostachys rosea f. rosea IK726]|uniref:Uncharacterized protein n=1 Tax=Clonostachys rosea f. rosea IK726 TaxID=1349383 RepID=A0ACA9UTG8_BIOOC|nr:unnamed protein product [Clonostachys rosea f. rosea IK726]